MRSFDNDIFLAGMIYTLQVIQDMKKEEDINLIDFDYLIDIRKRDLHDPKILENVMKHEEENEVS